MVLLAGVGSVGRRVASARRGQRHRAAGRAGRCSPSVLGQARRSRRRRWASACGWPSYGRGAGDGRRRRQHAGRRPRAPVRTAHPPLVPRVRGPPAGSSPPCIALAGGTSGRGCLAPLAVAALAGRWPLPLLRHAGPAGGRRPTWGHASPGGGSWCWASRSCCSTWSTRPRRRGGRSTSRTTFGAPDRARAARHAALPRRHPRRPGWPATASSPGSAGRGACESAGSSRRSALARHRRRARRRASPSSASPLLGAAGRRSRRSQLLRRRLDRRRAGRPRTAPAGPRRPVIARFNQFNYVGALFGAVLTGLVGAGSLRVGFAVPMVLILGDRAAGKGVRRPADAGVGGPGTPRALTRPCTRCPARAASSRGTLASRTSSVTGGSHGRRRRARQSPSAHAPRSSSSMRSCTAAWYPVEQVGRSRRTSRDLLRRVGRTHCRRPAGGVVQGQVELRVVALLGPDLLGVRRQRRRAERGVQRRRPGRPARGRACQTSQATELAPGVDLASQLLVARARPAPAPTRSDWRPKPSRNTAVARPCLACPDPTRAR